MVLSQFLFWILAVLTGVSAVGVVVTQKLGAQAIPVIGALGGAAVNYAFIEHFQDVARGHFIVRRLERSYGKDLVRAEYERLRAQMAASSSPGRREAARPGDP